jgi:hypothetical protein
MNIPEKAATADSISNKNTPISLSKHKLMRQPRKKDFMNTEFLSQTILTEAIDD